MLAGSATAQQWELSGLIGYGIYRDVSINSAFGTATAGIRNRFVAGAILGEDLFNHLSGEIRYMYQDGDPFISLGNQRGNIQGQSHSFQYDLLFNPRDREEHLRPYISAGIGGKYYRTTGAEPFPQPLPQIATLVQTNQWTVLYAVGAGLKYRFHKHVIVRVDFRDEITPFPKHLWVPTGNATDRGIFNQFTPTAGVGYLF